jgi:nucleotide-binding universal stress UspA family protein
MDVTSILAVVDGGPRSGALTKASFDFAKTLNAYLEVLHVQPDPRDALPVVGEGMTGTLVEQVSADIEARRDAALKVAREAYESECEAHGVAPKGSKEQSRGYKSFSVAWTDVEGREDEVVADLGRFFDLIVVAHPGGDEGSAYAPALETGLFQCGRPVLVLPQECGALPSEAVAVAWNGSREAVRAITAAMPFLQAAKSVRVISIGEEEGAASAERLSAFLAGHGIEPQFQKLEGEHGEVGALLIRQAVDDGAGMVVMGAYGHSRLREFVLGGATRSVLNESSLPLLLAH